MYLQLFWSRTVYLAILDTYMLGLGEGYVSKTFFLHTFIISVDIKCRVFYYIIILNVEFISICVFT